ncbi:hypothetical protein GCM10009662_15190 [Catellatospora coxensis]|uniref:Uncharacterized protein n=1 Tax=Catellatospora coxensis TaxID=310354 RepID=A0A8J3L3P0_9ACTN|nr:hypothetical protein Cco03nite_50940 [Catellatospora coxensis]
MAYGVGGRDQGRADAPGQAGPGQERPDQREGEPAGGLAPRRAGSDGFLGGRVGLIGHASMVGQNPHPVSRHRISEPPEAQYHHRDNPLGAATL